MPVKKETYIKPQPTPKMPKTIGLCADRLYQLREERLKAQKLVDAMETEEKALKEHIIETLPKSDSSGAAGKVARVSVIVKEVPQVADWDKLYAHVKKTGAFELLQRRLTAPAIQERWDAGKTVPGVEAFKVVSVSLNKL